MKKESNLIIYILSLATMLLVLSACNSNNCNRDYSTLLVDERYEIIALLFRLAGRPEFNQNYTNFHEKLDYTFSHFRDHPAVLHARRGAGSGLGRQLMVAIHIQKIDGIFVPVENIKALTPPFSNMTERGLANFVNYLNDFYVDTNFAVFFQEHYEYFAEHSARYRNQILDQINFEWFRQFGLSPDNMRAIISPNTWGGMAGWQYVDNYGERIVYSVVPTSTNYNVYWHRNTIIHEFVHSFSVPIAEYWLRGNREFSRWVIDTLDPVHLPWYTIFGIANEYITRALTILYLAENSDECLIFMFEQDMALGFRYIQEVYALITDHEIINLSNSIDVSNVLGVIGIYEYLLGEEQVIYSGGVTTTWQFLDLLGHELTLDKLPANASGNIWGSETGQALYVFHEDSKFIYIDLGTAEEFGWDVGCSETRAYFRMRIF